MNSGHALILQACLLVWLCHGVVRDELSADLLTDMWHDEQPKGMETTIEKIRDLILPSMLQLYVCLSLCVCCHVNVGVYRADSKPLHCNILLTGPVGVGMGTVVKAIARQLNMHLIQVSDLGVVVVSMNPTVTDVDRLTAMNIAVTQQLLQRRSYVLSSLGVRVPFIVWELFSDACWCCQLHSVRPVFSCWATLRF